MKRQISAIAIASVFAITPLFAVAATHFEHRDLGVKNNLLVKADNPRFDERDVGIGQYSGRA